MRGLWIGLIIILVLAATIVAGAWFAGALDRSGPKGLPPAGTLRGGSSQEPGRTSQDGGIPASGGSDSHQPPLPGTAQDPSRSLPEAAGGPAGRAGAPSRPSSASSYREPSSRATREPTAGGRESAPAPAPQGGLGTAGGGGYAGGVMGGPAGSATPPAGAANAAAPAAQPGTYPGYGMVVQPPASGATSSASADSGSSRQDSSAQGTATSADSPLNDNDPSSDRRPPVLVSLRFDPPEVQGGGTTTFIIEATDDLSGVKTAYGTLRSPSGAANLPFSAQVQEGSSLLPARIMIPKQAETGDWYVGNIQVFDRANNVLIASFSQATVPAGGALRVSSPDSDSTPPEVRRIWVEKSTIPPGEKNLVHVDISDDNSGVASVSGSFQSPAKTAMAGFGCRLNPETGVWDGDVQIPANADCGEWTLLWVHAADKANNIAYLTGNSPQLGTVSFMVTGGGECDSTPPSLDALALSPATVSNESAAEITVTATVSDVGTGAESLNGRVEGPVATNGQTPRIYFSASRNPSQPDAPWTSKITVPQFAAKGLWKVVWVQIQDKARNSRFYTVADSVLAGAVFTVE